MRQNLEKIPSYDAMLDFQLLLNQFKGNLEFKGLISRDIVSPDEYLYQIETNEGEYYIFETDYIPTFSYVTDFLKENTNGFSHPVEVKEPAQNDDDTSPFNGTFLYPKPDDWDEFKQYVNAKYGSHVSYFNFLIKI